MNLFLPILLISLLVVFSVDVKQKRRTYLETRPQQENRK
jgi:hypothetical protein